MVGLFCQKRPGAGAKKQVEGGAHRMMLACRAKCGGFCGRRDKAAGQRVETRLTSLTYMCTSIYEVVAFFLDFQGDLSISLLF